MTSRSISSILFKTRMQLFVATLCSFCVISAHAAVTLPTGFTVQRSNERAFSFTYAPVVQGWEQIREGGMVVRRPVIDNAALTSVRVNDRTEWYATFQLVTPGPNAFHLTADDRVRVRYEGVAGNTHVLRMDVLVATVTSAEHHVESAITGTITFDANEATSRRSTATALPLSALNAHDVSWSTLSQRQPRVGKMSETTQVAQKIDKAFAFTVTRDGVYRITADELRRNGLPTDASAARTLHVFGNGGMELPEVVSASEYASMKEQAVNVRTNSDGSIRDVIFFAGGPVGYALNTDSVLRHTMHHYSTTSSYVVIVGGADRRVQEPPAPIADATVMPTTATGLVVYEDEVVNPYNSGSGRRWLGRSFENGGSLTFTTLLPGLVRSGTIDYVLSAASRAASPGVMTITENGSVIAQLGLDSDGYYMDAYIMGTTGSAAASTIPGDNRSVLKFAYSNSSDKNSMGVVDFFEIHYPRALAAIDNTFDAATPKSLKDIAQYDVNGFSGEIFGFDVTKRSDPQPLVNYSTTGGMFSARVVGAGRSERRLFLSSAVSDVSLRPLTIANLRAEPRTATLVIITHPALRNSADSMAAYRAASSGIPVTVITTEEIFNEFSYGMPDPTAIRDAIKYMFSEWPTAPRYVLLWGDGHFDYKNLTTSATNFVLPFESDEPDGNTNGLYTHTTDDYYTRVIGNDPMPELAIGRLPVTSNDVGMQILSKIRAYEHQSSDDDWRTRITMIADDSPTGEGQVPDGALHLNQSERLATQYVPATFQDKKIYLVEYPTENVARGRRKPGVTDDMVSTTNTSGELILNWIGHGNPRVWAHENIFIRETTVPLMTNAAKNFFLTAATCDFARFDLPDNQSGAEELVLSQIGGAIGVFSASRVVLSQSNAEINQYFYANLFAKLPNGRYPTLGDVMYVVKQRYNDDNAEKFFLLGDPSMRLLIPDRSVVFDTINGNAMKDSVVVNFESKATVTVQGYVTKLGSSEVDTAFTGVATISLYDSQVQLTVTDVDGTICNFSKLGAGLNRSSYRIDHGRFQATFVVPKDIAFSKSRATLYGYASSEGGEEHAMGVTSNITVSGVADREYDDFEGPAMSLFMDSRRFKSGDLVRRSPILIVDLNDKTGVNTTGVGIGHNLEATFDDGALIENLTSTFTTSLENSRAGTATKQIFGLAQGVHTVRVRAWDVLNNYAEQETIFRIESATDGAIGEGFMNYPNPFSSQTLITFKHNQPQPFDAQVSIYTVNGSMVYDKTIRIEDLQTAAIPWNGRSSDGSSLPSAVYYCVIRLAGVDGSNAVCSGSMTLIR